MIDHARLLECLIRAKKGHRSALNEVCASMLGLVRRLAASFYRTDSRAELDDLVQEGLLAVVGAVRWFDPERGFRFSTYAGDCIRRRMARYMGKRGVQPLPQEPARVRGVSALESIPERRRPQVDLARELDSLLTALDPRSRLIVAMRYGIDGQASSIRMIGQRLGMHPMLVRTLYRSGTRALKRHSTRSGCGRQSLMP